MRDTDATHIIVAEVLDLVKSDNPEPVLTHI